MNTKDLRNGEARTRNSRLLIGLLFGITIILLIGLLGPVSAASWTQVGAGLPGTYHGLQRFATNNGNLYAGTDGDGVYELNSAGTTWTQVGSLTPGSIVPCLANYNGNLYAGSWGNGVWELSGTTWNQVGSLTGWAALPNCFESYNGNLYTGTNEGVWELSGTTWTQVGSGLSDDAANVNYLVAYNGNLYAGTNGGGVYELNSAGTTWTQVSYGPTGSTILVRSLAGYNSNLYAATYDDGVKVWGGTTWNQVGSIGMIAWCLENYNGNLYLGTVGDGVYELNSAGTAWSQVGSSLNKAVIQSLISYNGNLYAYTQNGVWVYSPSVSPTITGISPTTGPLEGGTLVTLSGSGFTGATSVIFGSTTATSFTVNSDTQITAMSPADSAGIVYVTVTGPGGTSSASIADQFTYVYPIPG